MEKRNCIIFVRTVFILALVALIGIGCGGGGGGDGGNSAVGGSEEDPDSGAPVTVALPAGGTYTSVQSVTLSTDETSTIYYTTDGSTPTISSSIYSSPINISVDTTLKFFAVDSSANIGPEITEIYIIQLSVSMSGTVMKGAVQDATVSIYDLNSDGTNGDLLQSTTTDSNGEYSLSFVAESPVACYMIEASGGLYTDEITGADIMMESSDILRAVECGITAGQSYVFTITPLTSIAAARATALAAAGGTLTTAVATSNLGVAQQYGIDSILTVVPVDPTNESATELATRSQRNYGIVLAGLASLANTNNVRAIDFSAALADDVVDGIMDGQGSSGDININRISAGTYIMDRDDGVGNLQGEIDNFLAGPNNNSNTDEMKIAPTAVNVGLNTAGLVYISSTVLPAWIEGQSGSYTLTAADGTQPYVWSVAPGSTLPSGFSLSDDGLFSGTAPLLAPGSTMSISPPFTVRVTDNNGNFADLVLHLTVIREPPTINVNPEHTGTVNEYFARQVATATGGVPPYYYVLNSGGDFPPFGLTLGTNGYVTGIPTVVGSRTFSVCVVDSAGAKDCDDVTITIVRPTGQIMFWTSVSNEGNISISVDGSSVGALSYWYSSAPGCGASGGLQLTLEEGSHSYSARSDAGTTWSNSFTITANQCLQYQLIGSGGGSGDGNCVNTFTCGGGNYGVTQLASCGYCPDTTYYHDTIYIGGTAYWQCVCP